MNLYVVGRFTHHDQAENAVVACQKEFPDKVSLSSTTPHEEWWNKDNWLETSLEAIGGVAASVAQVVPGFGVLFLGGPLDGVRQGQVLADWLMYHPHHKVDDKATFVILLVDEGEVEKATKLLSGLGADHVHHSTVK